MYSTYYVLYTTDYGQERAAQVDRNTDVNSTIQ